MTRKLHPAVLAALSFGAVCFLFAVAMPVFGLLPFGTNDFLWVDPRIQYTDLHAWLQRILQGEDSPVCSFYRGMGVNVWPVFTYFLTSPWNLLVLLFHRDELYLFYDTVVMLKLATAAGTMAVYLACRFERRIPSFAVVLLAAAYAMSEYAMNQLTNSLWLDGLYMLPLVLLGVWRAVSGRGLLCMILSGAAAIVFNWYSGLIDLTFAGMFAFWEAWVVCGDTFWRRKFFGCVGRAYLGILLGTGLSAALLLPTIVGFAGGRGTIDWHVLTLSYHGQVPKLLVTGQAWASLSRNVNAALFVGTFAYLGAISCFLNPGIPKRWRKRALVLVVFLLLAFYWRPFYFLFSLLKEEVSYWYRYGSIGIFILVYLAGWNATHLSGIRQIGRRTRMAILFVIPVAFVLGWWREPSVDSWYLCANIAVFLLIGITMFFAGGHLQEIGRRRVVTLLVALSLFDLWCNFGGVIHYRARPGIAASYAAYVEAQDAQLAAIRAAREDFQLFCATQTATFNMSPNYPDGLTLNYNEGLATGVRSLASYQSAYTNAQLSFMDRWGYRRNNENMCIVNTSVLGTDSLLGVKYVFADHPIQGLERMEGIPAANGKEAYENPFVLPVAFVAQSTEFSDLTNENPFLHANAVYGTLFGQPMEVYLPVPVLETDVQEKMVRYRVPATPEGQLYGNLPGDRMGDHSIRLHLDGDAGKGYLAWSAPSVFDIPERGSAFHEIVLTGDRPLPQITPQFYRIDESVLREAAALAWSRAADVTLGKAAATIRVTAGAGEQLFTSIPWDKGWHATLNGRDVTPACINGALLGFTLDEGENTIELRYELPGLPVGIAITILSLFATVVVWRRCW